MGESEILERAVSRQNVETIRAFLEAFNRRDYAACLEAIDPDVEWHPPPDLPDAAVATSRDALIANFREWFAAWADYRAVPEELVEGCDDTVVVFGQEVGRGIDSSIEVRSRRIAAVYQLRDQRIVRFKAYLDRAEALEAAGLRE
jgi:ketosteroid isomerase-like protein